MRNCTDRDDGVQFGMASREVVTTVHTAFIAQMKRQVQGERDPRNIRDTLSITDLVPQKLYKKRIPEIFLFSPNHHELFKDVTHVDDSIGDAVAAMRKKRKRGVKNGACLS
jgi:hypothetical protein